MIGNQFLEVPFCDFGCHWGQWGAGGHCGGSSDPGGGQGAFEEREDKAAALGRKDKKTPGQNPCPGVSFFVHYINRTK